MASISGFIPPPADAVVLPAPVLAMHLLRSRMAYAQGGAERGRVDRAATLDELSLGQDL